MPLLILIFTAFFFIGKNPMFHQTLPVEQETFQYMGCEPNLEMDKWMTLSVDSEKQIVYPNHDAKRWVLIKRTAPIPAWKVIRGEGKLRETDGIEIGEMEKFASVLTSATLEDIGKDVYIGLGHCKGDEGSECLDPLVQSTVFVLQKEGVGPPLPYWALPPWLHEDGTRKKGTHESDREEFWWRFDVYLDESFFQSIPNPTNDDLPCWTKLVCGGGDVHGEARRKAWEDFLDTGVCNPPLPDQNAQPVEQMGFASVDNAPSLIYKNEINITNPSFDSSLLNDTYSFIQQITQDPTSIGAITIGVNPHHSPELEIAYSDSSKILYATTLPIRDKIYSYQPIVEVVKPDAHSLQLGTFTPKVISAAAYEWWTPACKPAIYLYPEKPLSLNVQVIPQGRITVSDPKYPNGGWNVIAYPDGKIQSSEFRNQNSDIRLSTIYPYLYYEAEIEKVRTPDNGWIIEKNQLTTFFPTILTDLGLMRNEINDFMDYWVPKLSEGERWFVGLIDRNELNEIEKIEFSQKPDTFIRVRFYFQKLEKNTSLENKTILSSWNIENSDILGANFLLNSSPKRQGFVAVDWGGIVSGCDCGLPVVSK